MKQILLFLGITLLWISVSLAQVPNKLNYQAVIRNSAGELVAEQDVAIKISILDALSSGNLLYSEIHSVSTNLYGQFVLKIGGGSEPSTDFSNIDWSEGEKFIKVEVDVAGGSNYLLMGTNQMLSVPYAMYSNLSDSSRIANTASSAETASTAYTLGSNGVYSPESDTLFVVKDHSGNVVFAVFPDGAQVIVNETAKGKVGGFAVSGRTPSKAGDIDVLRVTPDSTRIYVNDTVNVKGKVGGFAVSGRTPSKGSVADILFVTADSTRVYVNEESIVKGKVGGFAVSGRTPSKAITNSYLKVLPDSTRIYVKDSTAGFGVANIEGGSAENFLNLNKQNYLIGHQTGSNTTGTYNSMIGYQAGYTNSSGSNNIFFGYKAGYLNQSGGNNVFIGTESGYVNQFTFQNTYVGYRSGYELSGAGNTVMGSMAGENAAGGNNTFIGASAGRKATGGNNTFVGNDAGYSSSLNTGVRNTYIGQKSGAFTTSGSYNVMLGFDAGYLNYEGSRNTFLGYDAGHNIHEGSGNVFIGHHAGTYADGINNRLIIENENVDSTEALIYGEFDQNHLRINGNVAINYQAYNNYGLIVDVPDGQTSTYTLWVYGDAHTTGVWHTSDEKFKKEIYPISNALSGLKGITGVSYEWKKDEYPKMKFSNRKQIGFLASEVEKVYPELVKKDDKGNKAVNYSKFTPILVEAIKEQQNQIEKLKEENNQLKARLERLEEMLLK